MNSVENKNQEKTNQSINLLNNSNMTELFFKLNIDFNGTSESIESRDNQPAFGILHSLSEKGYYFMMQPKTIVGAKPIYG